VRNRISLLVLMLCAAANPATAAPAPVDAARLRAADSDATQWLMDGRNYMAQRFSPLQQINESNVAQLGLAWYAELDTLRGVEGTPLFVDGVLYNTSAWNITTAYNAKTGRRLWTFDPEVPREWGRYACCEPVARGLAFWKGKVIIATLDGRLIGLNARNGKPVWTSQTFDKSQPYSITGAPRVFDGKVVVGNAGADLGVRGFVSAWDADTGRLLWKFYLVPGDPAKGPDGAASDSVMAMAARTWSGEWWKLGGGGTAWDSIAYDPELQTVFVGTGNGSPVAQLHRSPQRGDNLFLCSIVALDANIIDGKPRKVLMHAPKNGFFYVIDRTNGQFIHAKNHVSVTWTHGLDPVTGKPDMNPEAHYGTDPVLVAPGPGGGHNWFPMAFSPQTGLAYFPQYEHWFIYGLDPNFRPQPFRSNGGWGGYSGNALRKRQELQKLVNERERTALIAWDPVKQEIRWSVPLPRHGNGGVLATAGNLVFEGTTRQTFAAFRATDGAQLWEMPVQSAPVAGPISYEMDGVQYIAVNAGWGGGAAQIERGAGTAMHRASARLLVFKLGGRRKLPPLGPAVPVPEPPPLRAPEATVQKGAEIFARTCAQCHGQLAVGGVKDLRQMTRETHAQFNDIVLKGTRVQKGMASFANLLSVEDTEAVHAYVIARANEDWGSSGSGTGGPH
jgi:quinohemoprotein ethanol dehydrogenase